MQEHVQTISSGKLALVVYYACPRSLYAYIYALFTFFFFCKWQIISMVVSRNHRTLLLKRLGAFWRNNDIGGVTSDFGLLCMPIVYADIDDFLKNRNEAKVETIASMEYLCIPLLDAIDDHLNEIILNSMSSSGESSIDANLQSKTVTLLHLLAHILTASGT